MHLRVASRGTIAYNKMMNAEYYKNADNNLAPCLAESCKMLDGGKIWIFKLRKDVYFHNGRKFNTDL